MLRCYGKEGPLTESAAFDRRAILARSEILRHLAPEQIELLASRCTVRRCAAGEMVFQAKRK